MLIFTKTIAEIIFYINNKIYKIPMYTNVKINTSNSMHKIQRDLY